MQNMHQNTIKKKQFPWSHDMVEEMRNSQSRCYTLFNIPYIHIYMFHWWNYSTLSVDSYIYGCHGFMDKNNTEECEEEALVYKTTLCLAPFKQTDNDPRMFAVHKIFVNKRISFLSLKLHTKVLWNVVLFSQQKSYSYCCLNTNTDMKDTRVTIARDACKWQRFF